MIPFKELEWCSCSPIFRSSGAGRVILLLKLGNVLMESQQWVTAAVILRHATIAAEDNAVAWEQLGWVLWQQDKISGAKEAFEAARCRARRHFQA